LNESSRSDFGAPASGVSLCFVIPVRHHENAVDWPLLCRNLEETTRSIAAQTSSDWRGIVVANTGSKLPALPSGFDVVRVDFPPNPAHSPEGQTREQFLDHIRLDKGRRVLAGLLTTADARFVMTVDDDDLVSRRLVAFLSSRPADRIWSIDEGFCWTPGSRILYRYSDFSMFCGTSLVIPRAAFKLPATVAEADPEDVKVLFGSHVLVQDRLKAEGWQFDPIPFKGAIYRIGHAGNHSKAKSVLETWLLNKHVLRSPRRIARSLLRLRIYGPGSKREFGLP
jgi:hypothetical protein